MAEGAVTHHGWPMRASGVGWNESHSHLVHCFPASPSGSWQWTEQRKQSGSFLGASQPDNR